LTDSEPLSGAAERVLRLIRESGEPKTALDAAKELAEPYDTVVKALRRLMALNLIMPCGFRSQGVGRPEILYTSLELVTRAWLTVDESDLRRFEEEVVQISTEDVPVIDTIAKSLIEQFDPSVRDHMEDALSAAYIRLTAEDPVDLLLLMAEWTANEFEKSLRDFVSADQIEAKERASRKIERVVDFGFKIFNKYLSVLGDETTGPFRVGLDFSSGKVENDIKRGVSVDGLVEQLRIFKKKEVKEHLRRHVLGGNFFEKKLAEPPVSHTVVSTDASIQHIVADLGRFGFLEPAKAALTAAVAAWYGVDGEKGEAFLDPYPDPSTWTKFATEQAVRDGYLIPPEVAIELDPVLWRRTLEACMDLRQYAKDDATMAAALSGRPTLEKVPPPISALIRDGRVFPWEHTASDFVQPPPHGFFVRQCLTRFWKAVEAVNGNEEMLYGGAVKWSQIEIFARLIFWYLKYGSAMTGKRIWKDDDDKYDDTYIFGKVTTDQRLVKHAFQILSEKVPTSTNERWVTFRTIRRFYSLADSDRLSLKKLDEKEWEKEIGSLLGQKPEFFRRQINPRLYASLCTRAAILSFYIQPSATLPKGYSEEIVQLPRYEILVPYNALEDRSKLEKIDERYTSRLVQIVADPRMTDIYSTQERYDREVFLIFLKPARFAHEYVKGYALDSKRQVFGLLVQRLSRFLPEVRRRKEGNLK